MRRPHDVGGLEAGPIGTEEHPSEPWEKRVRAMQRLLSRRQSPIMKVDELRRGIEDLGAQDYSRLSYHECWTASIANILLQKGVISGEELGRKMDEVATRWKKNRAQ
jgi:Nitrile hydratase beta subunit